MSVSQLLPATSKAGTALRPPWALAEWAFLQKCDGCGACVEACREGILFHGRGGLPEVDFRYGGCDFCGACVSACPSRALRATGRERQSPFRFRIKVTEECLSHAGEPCRTCVECCENYAIQILPAGAGVMSPHLDAARCNGCGSCVGPCPVNAIELGGMPLPGVAEA